MANCRLCPQVRSDYTRQRVVEEQYLHDHIERTTSAAFTQHRPRCRLLHINSFRIKEVCVNLAHPWSSLLEALWRKQLPLVLSATMFIILVNNGYVSLRLPPETEDVAASLQSSLCGTNRSLSVTEPLLPGVSRWLPWRSCSFTARPSLLPTEYPLLGRQ